MPGARATVTGVVPTATPLISTAAPLGSEVMVSSSLASGWGGCSGWGRLLGAVACATGLDATEEQAAG